MKRFMAILVAGILAIPAAGWGANFHQPVTPYTQGTCAFRDASCPTHVGTDHMAPENRDVVAISRGYAFYYDNDAGSFGGCNVDGVALWIKHRKENGDYFWALYGHVKNSIVTSPEDQVVAATILPGQKIADIADYYPCYNLDGNCGTSSCPHLHFGIWDNQTAPCGEQGSIRCSQWGYGSQGSFTDPDDFLANEHPYPETLPAYHCDYVSQRVNGVLTSEASGPPGTTFTFAVTYKNDGAETWQNTGGTGNPHYVELRSVSHPSGVSTDSWLDPVGWVSGRQRVVSCTPSSVPTGSNATLTFQAKIPTNATPGNSYQQYFRPFHGTTGMEDWGGMYFLIHVQSPPGPCGDRQIVGCTNPPHPTIPPALIATTGDK